MSELPDDHQSCACEKCWPDGISKGHPDVVCSADVLVCHCAVCMPVVRDTPDSLPIPAKGKGSCPTAEELNTPMLSEKPIFQQPRLDLAPKTRDELVALIDERIREHAEDYRRLAEGAE